MAAREWFASARSRLLRDGIFETAAKVGWTCQCNRRSFSRIIMFQWNKRAAVNAVMNSDSFVLIYYVENNIRHVLSTDL